MKKILFVLIVVLTFVGCSKPEREVYVECELLTNPDACTALIFTFQNSTVTEGDNITPVSAGFSWTSESFSLFKGSNATVNCSLFPYLSNSYQYEVKLYVDGNLEETRTATGNPNINLIIP